MHADLHEQAMQQELARRQAELVEAASPASSRSPEGTQMRPRSRRNKNTTNSKKSPLSKEKTVRDASRFTDQRAKLNSIIASLRHENHTLVQKLQEVEAQNQVIPGNMAVHVPKPMQTQLMTQPL